MRMLPLFLPVPADLPEVSGAESDEWLVFEVTDTGCGISQRGLGSLFTEYVQVGALYTYPGCVSGLPLSYAFD